MSTKPIDYSKPGVTARLYCQGIGDCHLLKFVKDDGAPFWMLIDCGVHTAIRGGSDLVRDIAHDIFEVTQRLDVIVLTHEHWDHSSGFLRAEEHFKKFSIGEVWLAWTENPGDSQAARIDKFKTKGAQALALAADELSARARASADVEPLRAGVVNLFGFLGDMGDSGLFSLKGEQTRQARDTLVKLGKDKGQVIYLAPTDAPISLKGLSDIRIYVLGPPRDETLLRTEIKASEMYGMGVSDGVTAAEALLGALDKSAPGGRGDAFAPFDENEGYNLSELAPPTRATARVVNWLSAHYGAVEDSQAGKDAWRRIDHDWLNMSAGLAMQLDKGVNNTSLVLAFEFVQTGRVMLFPGDAQVGNWLSWRDLSFTVNGKTISSRDLLARTVFYKVGHHGSENATLKQNGLELMSQEDFAAFIPTNEKDAQNVGWGAMPFGPILNALEKRAEGRVIRADDQWIQAASSPDFAAPSGCLRGVRASGKAPFWVELDIA